MPIGSCRRGIASLLGVSQVTLFCSGLCRTKAYNCIFIIDLKRIRFSRYARMVVQKFNIGDLKGTVS
jgi:hypothetical protein